MPKLETFNVYLSIGGFVFTTDLISVDPEHSSEGQDYTSGVNQEWMQRAAGLKDSKFTIKASYDTAIVDDLVAAVKPGVAAMIYGPEGNTTGKPKHAQSVHVSSVKYNRNVDKSMTVFDIACESADTPTSDMFNGGVW